MNKLNLIKTTLAVLVMGFTLASEATAFCGFYVAKAGAELFNNKSQVILVRDGNKTVITMSNDFSGNVKDFAMVVPVPTVLKRNEIRISNQQLFSKLDSYSGPRLVEYYDENPCMPQMMYETMADEVQVTSMRKKSLNSERIDREDYKVVIEAKYAVGEYDILILSAQESDGLKRWLTDNGYAIPAKAERVLEPYIKSKMKFFVVKVNAAAHALQGFQQLRPLQIEFESEKFMLPIRLGMANSTGEQDMIVYAFTKKGRVETANYRTLEIPSNRNIPVFVKEKFGQFYVDLFDKSHRLAGRNTVFLEYAWDVSPSWNGVKCDPCVGPPPINMDFVQAGVWWLQENAQSPVFFTRLHVRYAEEQFPEDLTFLVTPNKEQFQGRYILTHPAEGDLSCEEGQKYKHGLFSRRSKELKELSALTDWNVAKYTRYAVDGSSYIDERKNVAPVAIIPESPNPGTPSTPIIIWIAMAIVLLVLLSYFKTLVSIYQPQRPT